MRLLVLLVSCVMPVLFPLLFGRQEPVVLAQQQAKVPSPQLLARVKICSLLPAEGQRAFLLSALPGAPARRELAPEVWALVAPGPLQVGLVDRTGLSVTKEVTLLPGEERSVALLLSRQAFIEGLVKERGGEPLGGLPVWFLPREAAHPKGAQEARSCLGTVTDPEGRFLSPALEPSLWSLSFGPPGRPLDCPNPGRILARGLQQARVTVDLGSVIDIEGAHQHPVILEARRTRALPPEHPLAWRTSRCLLAGESPRRFTRLLPGEYRIVMGDQATMPLALSPGLDARACGDSEGLKIALVPASPAPGIQWER